jgi:hypothetical protein
VEPVSIFGARGDPWKSSLAAPTSTYQAKQRSSIHSFDAANDNVYYIDPSAYIVIEVKNPQTHPKASIGRQGLEEGEDHI